MPNFNSIFEVVYPEGVTTKLIDFVLHEQLVITPEIFNGFALALEWRFAFNVAVLCTTFQLDLSMRSCFIAIILSVRKDEE